MARRPKNVQSPSPYDDPTRAAGAGGEDAPLLNTGEDEAPSDGSFGAGLDALNADLDAEGDGDDLEIQPFTPSAVIKSIMSCREESASARKTRMRLNNINRDAYMGLQDWGHKLPGQSREFLPKTSSAVEQFTAFIKKSLIGFGDWFRVSLSEELEPIITDNQVRKLVKYYLGKMPEGFTGWKTIESVLADGGKVGLLESLTVLKVYGRDVDYNEFYVEPGADNLYDLSTGQKRKTEDKLRRRKKQKWHLCVDLIRDEDYYPDPTGRGLYEIHEVERDWIDVLALAKQGVYDLDQVEAARLEDMPKPISSQENRRPSQIGQNRAENPVGRRRAIITEYWGVLLDEQGGVIGKNVVATVLNKKYLIRDPTPNPFWHGRSPFISHPLVRVPFSVFHKAMYDSASFLNFALNEMFNLILDGGISSVWGIKQLRVDHLADPKQVEGGIQQGVTLHVKDSLPVGEKVLETVSEGKVPPDAMAVMNLLNGEFNEAALTNELKLGGLPPTGTKATSIMTVEQNQSITMSSLTMDMEKNQMEPLLELSWLTILQHMSDIEPKVLVDLIGKRAAALVLMQSDAERFAMFANCASFKVSGLTATLESAQNFQKLMAFLQAVSQNPVLMQSFLTKYSPDRIIKVLMKQLNINPDDLANTPDEMKNLPQIMQQIMLFAKTFGAQGGQGQGAQDGQGGAGAPGGMPGGQVPLQTPPGSDPGMHAQVNQMVQPTSGLKLA